MSARHRHLVARLATPVVAAAIVALCGAATAVEAQSGRPAVARVPPAAIGEVYPAGTYRDLNSDDMRTVDLSNVIGKRPVILFYFIPSHARSEQMLLDFQERVEEVGADRVELYGVAPVGPGVSAESVRDRAREIGLDVPVLEDDRGTLMQQMQVSTVPNAAMIDSSGVLRLVGAASLVQTLEYKLDVAGAIEKLANTGKIGTFGILPRYFPAQELEGEPAPDFRAPDLLDGIVYRWSNLLDPRKVNALVFWAVDCPHCRSALPEWSAWYRRNDEDFQIVTAAKVSNEVDKTRTKEFAKLHGLSFRTLADESRNIAEAYNVTSTPTIFIIGPEGVIDTVLLSNSDDFGAELVKARERLIAD